MILVDSSVLIDFLKGRITAETSFLLNVVKSNIPFSIASICIQEILQGSKTDKEFKLLQDYLLSQSIVEPTSYMETYVAAAKLYLRCRKKGRTIYSSTDCFIAQIAIQYDLTLLHHDRDFDFIKENSSLKTVEFKK